MNREIKFRVWNIKFKKFVMGYENQNDYEELYSDSPGLLFAALNYLKKSDEYIIQQFTGVEDKNGKEIYEGDILKEPAYGRQYNYDPIMVKYHEYHGEDEMVCGLILPSEPEKCEIIGNIMENPELLK